MARLYRISADTSEKEKAVGGILTFGQAGWLVLGLIVFAAVFIGLSRVIPAVLGRYYRAGSRAGHRPPVRLLQEGGADADPVPEVAFSVPAEEPVHD